LDQIEPSILQKRSISFPYILSSAADEKALEIQAKTLQILDEMLNEGEADGFL
jgi:hypothetical protein